MRRSRAELLIVGVVVGACGGKQPAAPAAASCDRPVVVTSQADLQAIATCTSVPALTIKTAASVDVHALAHLEEIAGALQVGPTVSLDELALPALRHADSVRISANGSLRGVFLPALEHTRRIEVTGNIELATLSLPKLIRIDALVIADNAELQLVDLSALTELPGELAVSGSPRLDVVEAPNLPSEQLDRLHAR